MPRNRLILPAFVVAACAFGVVLFSPPPAVFAQHHEHHGHHYDPAVADAQKHLRGLHLYHGAIDGILGRQTRGALIQYQHDHKLPETGVPDATTMQRLENEPPH